MTFERLPTVTNAFTVMRWSGVNAGGVATVLGSGENRKLVLSVDLSQAACRDSGTTACGNGKYVVREVKAWPWSSGGSYLSTGSGKPMASTRTDFTFVGECG